MKTTRRPLQFGLSGVVSAIVILVAFGSAFATEAKTSAEKSTSTQSYKLSYVFPPKASESFQELTRDPFPTPCGKALNSVRLETTTAHLTFGDPPAFSVALTHHGLKIDRGRVTKTFRVLPEDNICPEAVEQVARILDERERESLFIQVETKVAENISNEKLPIHDMNIEPDATLWQLFLQGFFPILLVFTFLLIGFQSFVWIRRDYLKLSEKKSEKRAIVFTLGLSLFALAVGFLRDPLPVNWYPVVFPGYRYEYISILFVQIQPLVTRLGIAPEGWIAFWVTLAGAFCVLLSYLAARRFVSHQRAVFVALLMTVLPRMLMYYSSDCQHVVSLAVWLWGLLNWADFRAGNKKGLGGMILALVLLPMLRLETAWWSMLWIVLIPPNIGRRRLIRFALHTLVYGIAVFWVLNAIDYGHFDLSSLPYLPVIPWYYMRSLTQFDLLFVLFVGLFLLGLLTLFQEDKFLLATLYLTTCLSFLSGAVTGKQTIEFVSFRYFMAGLFPVMLIAAIGVDRIRNGLKNKIALGAALVVLIPALAVESYYVFHVDELPVFQQEYRFLKKELSSIKPGQTVCSISPILHHHFAKLGNDMDTSLYLPPKMENYFMLGIRWQLFEENSQDACDYYYENSVCQLRFPQQLYEENRMLENNLHTYYRLCEQDQQRFAKVLVAQTPGTQKMSYGVRELYDMDRTILMRLYKTKPDSMKN